VSIAQTWFERVIGSVLVVLQDVCFFYIDLDGGTDCTAGRQLDAGMTATLFKGEQR
jgi:hypothetical protein